MDATSLQTLLVKHRSLIDPEVHGLSRPTRQGRRAPGLSQQQMDGLLHRTGGTYARLEAGRHKNPSIELLRDVALILVMSEQEWVALCRYARGEDPPSALRPRSGKIVPGMWKDAVDGISHMAYVTDCSYNLLCHNQAFAGLFPETGPPGNMMRGMLLEDTFRGTLPDPRRGSTARPGILTDWATVWAPYVLPQLLAARALMPDDPILKAIEHDVRDDPRTGPIYASGTATQVHPDGNERPLLHPTLGPSWVNICAAGPLSSPNSRLMIVMVYPGEEQSHGRLPHLYAKVS
ncbi:helix-turn-helix domain-containing protein [Streptomyces sp. NPDC048516]|uniref:helix-turn-helix domain-containing protein n=1 Tax=Streptomyces sp. NPDC048516 TaxID=3365565 RepID=UPI00371816AB